MLALDTSTRYLVLGLPQAQWAVRLERRHAEEVWPMLEQFLQRCRVTLPELEGLAVGEGPGSYTGIRVGVAAGLGLARGLGLPLVGVNSLEACQRYAQPCRPALSQRQDQVFHPDESGLPRKSRLQDLYTQTAVVLDQPPSGRLLARLGIEALRAGQAGVNPIYL